MFNPFVAEVLEGSKRLGGYAWQRASHLIVLRLRMAPCQSERILRAYCGMAQARKACASWC